MGYDNLRCRELFGLIRQTPCHLTFLLLICCTHTHIHTHTNLSVHYARLLRWEPRRWPETAQWHSGERVGRHDDLPTGMESPHHRWDRTHTQGRRQLHHWRLLHLSLYALPKRFHTMPRQGNQQCFQNLDFSECAKLLCHLPFALKTVAGE